MKVWITRYALTQGVYEALAKATEYPSMINVSGAGFFHGEGREWHRTKESALARCEIMRAVKLKSLDKARKRIAALNFEAML